MGSSQLGVASAVQRGSTTCLHAFQCDKNAKPAEGEWAECENPQWGVGVGLGNAQKGKVGWVITPRRKKVQAAGVCRL